MMHILQSWEEKDKQIYLSSLSYVMNSENAKSLERKEFMKNKAREFSVPLTKIKKVKTAEELISLLKTIESTKVKYFIVRDMILMTLADHDVSDSEMKKIYDISTQIGISSEKVDDFFLWAAKGLEWQIAGARLVEDI